MVEAKCRLEVFAVWSDNNLHHIWQTAENNGWSNWENPNLNDAAPFFSPLVASNADGRIEVFAASADSPNVLSHVWQTAPNDGWSNWQSLGGNLAFHHPAIGRNVDARLEIFALSSQGDLHHVWQQ